MKKINIYVLAVLCSTFIYACATAPKTVVQEKPEEIKAPKEVKETVSPAREKENKSLDIFSEILDLVESTDDRQSVLPRIEELYGRIIHEYPDTPLAQESYWKLITIYLEDYNPPHIDKAESLYKEFTGKYPESVLRAIVEDTLGKGLYKHAQWAKLLDLCGPAYNEYIENGKQPRASLLFMYAEANFYLENIDRAKKSYGIVAELFPKLREGQKSKSMLEQLDKSK